MIFNNMKQFKINILLLYCSAGISIQILFILQGVLATNLTLKEILSYHFPAQFALIVLATIINLYYTKRKLYHAVETINSLDFVPDRSRNEIYYAIIEFPQKFFWMSFISYPGIIAFKYVYEFVFITDFSMSNVYLALFKFISSCSLLFLYSQTIMIFLRRFLRPLLLNFNKKELEYPSNLTFNKTISMFGIFFFICFVNIYISEHYSSEYYGNTNTFWGNLVFLTIITFSIVVLFLRMLVKEHVSNLKIISAELINIQRHDRRELHKLIPITSTDEIGVLTSSYNMVQTKIGNIYKDIDDDLSFARKVHDQLIPDIDYEDRFVQIKSLSRPAKEIGGDFYDFFRISDKKYVVIIGDVLGNGLSASLIMSMIIGHFRATASTTTSAKELLEDINRTLYPISRDGLFVTCGIGILDIEQGIFSYVSAGHLPPLINESFGSSYLESSSFPLGVSSDIRIKLIEIPIKNIEKIVLYTDGAIEQKNNNGEQFGFNRFQSLISQSSCTPENLLLQIHEFASQADIQDDISIFVITFCKRYIGV